MVSSVTEQIEIRRWQISDLDQATALNREASMDIDLPSQSGDWATDLADINETFIEPGGEFLVGIHGEDLVVMGGYIKLSDTTAEVKRMRVTPKLQGQGIGRWFLGILENSMLDAGIRDIELRTTTGQKAALKLYSGAGYSEVEKRPADNYGLTAVFFRKNISL